MGAMTDPFAATSTTAVGPCTQRRKILMALPGIVLHRFLVLGEAPSPDLVDRVIDQIILPAATGAHSTAAR